MKNKISFIFSLVLILLNSASVLAQRENEGMADAMRGSGKIYVVVAVLVTIFTGLILYLISIDRKISRLEKESKNK